MTDEGARDLLAATHAFPGSYTIKAIGRSSDSFVERVLAAARRGLERSTGVEHSVRETPGRLHQAVTLVLDVQTPEEVIRVYQFLQRVEGLKILL